MIKRISVYFLCSLVAFMPALRVQATPLALALPLFIDASVMEAVTFTGVGVSFSVVTNANTDLSPYVTTEGTLKTQALSTWFSDSPDASNSVVKSIIDEIGLIINGDELAVEVSPVPTGQLYIEPTKGYYWSVGGVDASSPTNAANEMCSQVGLPYCASASIAQYPGRPDMIITVMLTESGGEWAGSGRIITKNECKHLSANAKFIPATCQGAYKAEVILEKPDATWLQDKLTQSMSKRTPKELEELFKEPSPKALPEGMKAQIKADVAEQIELQPLPKMPDGSPLPLRGSQEWEWANSITRGTAQSTDENKEGYIPANQVATAEYLANEVAKGSDNVTALNATTTNPVVDENSSTTTGTTGNVVVNVDTSGIEQRIDLTNEILTNATTTTVVTKSFNEAVANVPMWSPDKYPNGFDGVWGEFKEKLDNTGLVRFIEKFRFSYGNGVIPEWKFCAQTSLVDFGCHSIRIDEEYWLLFRTITIALTAIYCRKVILGV